jgi:ferritin
LDHEISVTADWKNIHGLAVNDNDPTTMALALWFVTEQIEEEDKTMKLVQKLKLAGDGLALLQIDEMYKE